MMTARYQKKSHNVLYKYSFIKESFDFEVSCYNCRLIEYWYNYNNYFAVGT